MMEQPTMQSNNAPVNYTARYVPQTTTFNNDFKIDFSYLITKSGILKLLQQIFIVVAAISYSFSVVSYAHLDDRALEHYRRSPDTLVLSAGFGIFFYYIILGAILLPVVHVLMWSYLLHKVEKYTRYPWYTIEYVVCSTGTILCLIAAIFTIYRLFVEIKMSIFLVTIFTLAAGVVFIFNIILVINRKKMRLPLQDPVSAFSTRF